MEISGKNYTSASEKKNTRGGGVQFEILFTQLHLKMTP